MDAFPKLPDSAIVSRDGTDVFVSFHWDELSPAMARRFSLEMSRWLKKALLDMGAATVEEFDGGLSE